MLQWNKCDTSALDKTSSPIDAVVYGDTAYFRPRNRRIYSYTLSHGHHVGNGGWSKLAKCPVKDASLVVLPVEGVVQFQLHTIDGIKRKKRSTRPRRRIYRYYLPVDQSCSQRMDIFKQLPKIENQTKPSDSCV